MISVATVVVGVAAAALVRPWRVRPRLVLPAPVVAVDSSGPPKRRLVPTEALWGASVVCAFLVHPLLGLGVAVWPPLRGVRRRRGDRATSDRAVVRGMADVVDLIVLGVGAGLTPRAALARCEPWLPAPFAAVFQETRRRADAGESFAVALEAIAGSLGDPARPLVSAIIAAELTPGSVTPTLVRVGDEARRRRRVEAQERARRLPVTMVLPLVLCVLPAFGLLAVVPLLIATFRDLGLSP